MFSKTILIFVFFIFLFSSTVHAQIGYFLNIGFRDAKAIESRLEKQLAKGTLNSDKLFITSKAGKDSLSVITSSVSRPCRECLDAFLAKRQELEPYMDVQQEISKSLIFAIQNDDMAMFDYLIELKADVNLDCASCFDRSPLLMSLAGRKYRFFFKLMQLGANPYAIDKEKKNAFHMLLFDYYRYDGLTGIDLSKRRDTILAVIDTLVNRQVSVQQKDHEGFTPLIMAAGTGDAIVFEHLRSKGATVQLDNPAEVVTMLNVISLDDPYAPGSYTMKLYDKVISDFQIQLSKSLFDTKDFAGAYSIIYAVGKNNGKMFDLLMKYNVDVNVKDSENRSALSLAVDKQNAYMCGKLLDAGAIVDVNRIRYTGAFESNTVLMDKFKKARRAQKGK